MPQLTIAYSSLAERVKQIQFPDADYEFLVLVQNPNSQPVSKPDTGQLVEVAGKGVAKSRNESIRLCQTELLIFGDDDVTFYPEKLAKAQQIFNENPELCLLLLAANDEGGKPRKKYPDSKTNLSLFNSARAATYEMMIRPAKVRELGVWFDERFGAGADLYLGDEYIFIADLIKAGGKCEFAPIFVASHPADSSGERWGTVADRKARAAVFDRVFGALAPLVRLGFGLRRLKMLGGLKNLALFVVGK